VVRASQTTPELRGRATVGDAAPESADQPLHGQEGQLGVALRVVDQRQADAEERQRDLQVQPLHLVRLHRRHDGRVECEQQHALAPIQERHPPGGCAHPLPAAAAALDQCRAHKLLRAVLRRQQLTDFNVNYMCKYYTIKRDLATNKTLVKRKLWENQA